MPPPRDAATLRRLTTAVAVAFATVLAASACTPPGNTPETGETGSPRGAAAAREAGRDPIMVSRSAAAEMARADLRPTDGNTTSGVLEFTKTPGGILSISVEIAELAEGKHGLHVHDVGDCSAPNASSAGDHFSPDGHTHGAPADTIHHAGDLGNVTADSRGIAVTKLETSDLTLDGRYGVVGRAVIVHAGEDDFISQPAGDSGDRVACGVIRRIPAPVSSG